MMRKCHMNTCPVGIATQDKDLRAKYKGRPEHVVNFVRFLATELREIMAELGFKTVNEMVGRVDKLKAKKDVEHWKAKHLNLDKLLHKMYIGQKDSAYKTMEQDHGIDKALDNELINHFKASISSKEPLSKEIMIRNVHRTVGTMLSSEMTRVHGEEGLPEDTISIHAKGTAGQSFSAFANSGITFNIEGDANDYFGKGLCGAKLILNPPKDITYETEESVIVGNVAFYGATSGEAYIHGKAGERFAVRNSGVKVVVSSVGDHGCEYMTGGQVVILGEIGKNFAAGMSGGIAYIYDKENNLAQRINQGTVDLDPLDEDETTLKSMIEKYAIYTNASKASAILNDWENEKEHFIKVMPRDYKRVLNEQKNKLNEVA